MVERRIECFPDYGVTDEGDVYSYKYDKMRTLRPYPNTTGYLMVSLRDGGVRYSRLVHRLVLEAFVGTCPAGMEGCHGTKGKSINNLSNLYYGTHQDNCNKDRRRDGTYQSSLTPTAVQEIRGMHTAGVSQVVLARAYSVSQAAISNIVRRMTWKN